MSLVAYDDSDKDSESDDELVSEDRQNINNGLTEQKSDGMRLLKNFGNNSTDQYDQQPQHGLFESLPKPISREYREVVEEDDNVGFGDATFKSSLHLPPPKHDDYGKDDFQSTKGSNKKSEKLIKKITVPALSTFDSDDEDEPIKKKIKPAEGKSGLFAYLPPPKSAPKKITNRFFIPHSISKSQKTAVSSSITSDNNSDDEKETINMAKGSLRFFTLNGEVESNAVPAEEKDKKPSGITSTLSVNSCLEPALMGNDKHILHAAGEEDIDSASSSNLSELSGGFEESPADQSLELTDDMLLRLQGKRKHKNEEINIIEITQDDQLPKNSEWTKGLTEEKASHSHRFKTHAPTAQQRRKHQITYLAFQAKERELELKNQWAQNRLTKRQTQSKYGF